MGQWVQASAQAFFMRRAPPAEEHGGDEGGRDDAGEKQQEAMSMNFHWRNQVPAVARLIELDEPALQGAEFNAVGDDRRVVAAVARGLDQSGAHFSSGRPKGKLGSVEQPCMPNMASGSSEWTASWMPMSLTEQMIV